MLGSSYFENEISLINNEKIRLDICEILDSQVCKLNFSKPSSSTMKYHPQFANSKNGLVKHTRAVVKLALTLLDSRPDIAEKYRDHIIAACILHDMCKYEYGNKFTVINHAEVMSELFKETSKLPQEDRDIIVKLIRYHQGYFDQENDITSYIKYIYNNGQSLGEACLIVHYADMIASRKWYSTKNVFVEIDDK